MSCPPPLLTHKGHAWRPLISRTEASGTGRVSIPELRGSGSVTQGNTLQDSSVYSNVQKSIHMARSRLIGAPAPSSAQAPWVFHRTDTISLQGVHTEHFPPVETQVQTFSHPAEPRQRRAVVLEATVHQHLLRGRGPASHLQYGHGWVPLEHRIRASTSYLSPVFLFRLQVLGLLEEGQGVWGGKGISRGFLR